ncbi:MAG: T9SS type A sorting domain-containing protein [Bacteroidota bacterium]
MKKAFFTLLIILFAINSFAQFPYFSNNQINESIVYLGTHKNNHYTITYNSTNNNFTDSLTLTQFNNNGVITKQHSFVRSLNKNICNYFYITFNDTIINLWGYYYNRIDSTGNIFKTSLNYNFDSISSSFSLPRHLIGLQETVVKNLQIPNNDYFMLSQEYYADTSIFRLYRYLDKSNQFLEFTLDIPVHWTNTIGYTKENTLQVVNFYCNRLLDSLCSNTDTVFSLLTYSDSIFYETSISFKPYGTGKVLNDSTMVYLGEMYQQTSFNANRKLGLMKYYNDGTYQDSVLTGNKFIDIVPALTQPFDFITKDSIFLLGYNENESRVYIYNINEFGKLNWNTDLVMDTSWYYTAMSVVATEDGGCLVSAQISYTGQTQRDIVIWKIDKRGNVVNSVNLMKPNDKRIGVYPNPTSESISLSLMNVLNQEAQISIYNINGQKALATNTNDLYQPIDIQSLANGIYFIKVVLADKSVLDCKFIKK